MGRAGPPSPGGGSVRKAMPPSAARAPPPVPGGRPAPSIPSRPTPNPPSRQGGALPPPLIPS